MHPSPTVPSVKTPPDLGLGETELWELYYTVLL